ncbi:methyltransferase [Candidatus Saccharibacteria bacterium]|nr:methyltransferase [Candidatus Saccharibacteria bacterium]
MKHIIEERAPVNYRIPENIPVVPKFKTVLADPPWCKNERGSIGAIRHYDLMSLERIKAMPVADLADENAHLWLWVTNSNIDEGIEVAKAWGFTYRSIYHWIKLRMGLGYYLRNASESCLFCTRGKAPVKAKNQPNWGHYPVSSTHSEKPREIISTIERVSPGPYLELFCRRRPASAERWFCWGDETKGGADIFIPGYPVPKYSFEQNEDCDAAYDEDEDHQPDSSNTADDSERKEM